jgi:hypothetical protein
MGFGNKYGNFMESSAALALFEFSRLLMIFGILICFKVHRNNEYF